MPSEASGAPTARPFSCSVLAVGTELLLGQVVDTNSAFIGDRLARAGIDSHVHTRVGDNQLRIVAAIRSMLESSDVVLVCGGLGPTQDDITREAVAEALDVALVRDAAMAARIKQLFAGRGRTMAANNLRQADRPDGASFLDQAIGTAPGLWCETPEGRIVVAVPGVPAEMHRMLDGLVIPRLRAKAGARSVILSRMLRTWGAAESAVAEMIAERVKRQTNPTIAFLASTDGVRLRITAKAPEEAAATALLDAEEAELRQVLGSIVYGIDGESIEAAVGALLSARGLTLGVAESLTGGLVGTRLSEVSGASAWFRGSVVAYHQSVKFALLGVPEGPVVTPAAATAMAAGARRALGADVGLGVTGVAGPDTQEGQPVGTVFASVDIAGAVTGAELHLPGERSLVRDVACISLVDELRRRLLERA